MVNAASYTPLESLLLLTWIRSHGLDAFEATAFPKLSHDLINHDSVKQDPTYDASRLNPDSLQELFLHLLQEELKDEPVAQHDVAPGDASLSPNSRKRKRLSLAAHIKTLHEARQHAHRLPDAEAKLYTRYKERAAREIWERDQDLRKLEEEIRQLEQQERQAIEASNQRKSVSAAPSAAASPAGEACRPSSAVQTVDAQRPAQQPNGTTGQPPLPPTPIQTAVPSNAGPLLPRQVSPMRPVGTPTAPQPRVQSPVVPSGPFTQGGVGAHGSPKPPNPPTPVLQPPQGFPPLSPHPGQTPLTVTQPTSDVLQRPDSASKSRPPSQHAPQTQVPVQGPLKWEPPYQPLPVLQQQRPPHNIPQFQPPKGQQHQQHQQHPQHPQHPQQWSPQPPLQYPPPQPLQPPHQQGYGQQQGPPAQRPILVAPQPGGHAPPPLQPAPMRAHSGSPSPMQQQRLSQGPSPLHGHARPSQSPYQHTQQVFQPPHPLPHQARFGPNVSSTPPPPSHPPANQAPQQWQKPATPTQPLPPGLPQVQQPAASMPPLSSTTHVPPYNPSYSQPPRPAAVSQHILPQPVGTPSPGIRRPHSILPHIPTTKALAFHGPLGSGTRWKATQPTPSTPGPSVGELASPAFEPLSPVLQSVSLPASSAQPSPTRPSKPTDVDASGAKKLARRPRSTQRGLDAREGSRQRRTSSVASARAANVETDPDTATKVKREEATPRPLEEAGDTTADESVSGRHHPHSPRAARSAGKRKRQDSTTSDHWAAPEHRPRVPPPPPGIPTHVLWTRGFPRVSVSTLDQISGHKHANMFSHPIRERDAPGYKTIVLGPTDLKSIRAAITAGNKAAATAAAALPGGDPGTSSVWLPISEELVPPRGIINSSHLERELVHMFSNAIMYNLDPCRGPGPAFMKGSGRGGKGANETHAHGGHGGGADPGFIGYAVDENSVVNDTQAMFAEVDKLLMELRSTEAQSGPVPLPPGAVPASERLARVAPTAVAVSGASGTFKRRRIGRG
ncbi:hypothetical protein VPNG_08627 [Cytospora leucostoma]|uniref:Bromo domain-containing protein n=1 Tax=Cytospora leucostoma TaxID=1230097 RepID=A0A423W387_9PEZI|nr:hypothetical protein VPNG_08627 [Cytospora leucostoma]